METYTPLEQFKFSERTLNALVNQGNINSIEQLKKIPMDELKKIKWVWNKAEWEIKAVLHLHYDFK